MRRLITIPEELWEGLQELAAEQATTASQLIRDGIITTLNASTLRTVDVAEDLWDAWVTLAERRHTTPDQLIRDGMVATLAVARDAGEIPKQRRRKSA